MKAVLLAAVVLATLGRSAGQANELPATPSAEVVRFGAMSLSTGQSLRTVISNVLATANATQLAPCQVQVSFFGADSSLIGSATTVQLKAGQSTTVSVSQPSKLVRAMVSISNVADPATVCALTTSVEVFDLQTGTTFVMVPGGPAAVTNDCVVSGLPALGARRKNVSVREDTAPIPISPPPSAGKRTPKKSSPALAATSPTVQR
jgi:hypothetical protein